MPTFVHFSCKQCNSSLGTLDAYHSIGEPFLLCKKCNAINVISSTRNEWELKTDFQRMRFYGKAFFFSLVVGLGTGVFITEMLSRYANQSLSLFFSAPVGVGLWYYFFSADMRRSVRESKERMSNASYQNFLRSLGILR